MKKFVFKTIFFLLIILLIDRSFIIFRYNETNIFVDIANEKMKKIKSLISISKKYNLYVLGSSHTQFGVSTEMLSKDLNMKCLNVAYGAGGNIGKQLIILKKILEINKAKPPKFILFGLDVFALNEEPMYDDQFQSILFNSSENKYINFYAKYSNSYLNLYGRFITRYIEDVQKGVYTLPYFRKENSYDLSMFKMYDKFEISESGWVKGFGILNPNYIRYASTDFSPNNKALVDLSEFISICKNKSINLSFFQVPESSYCLKYNKKYSDFDAFMKKLSIEKNIPYYNFNIVDKFDVANDSLFFDTDHLNVKGAEIFTNLLASTLKNTR